MTPNPPPTTVIEIFGEGVTDIGTGGDIPASAMSGVVPVLVRRLCGDPLALLVKRKALQHLIGKGIWQKVRFTKQQASYNPHSVGCVFVLDSEGDPDTVSSDLERGRASCAPEFPMAVGVAHPCIEAWLLADASAVRRGFGLTGSRPSVPPDPETVPLHDAQGNNQLKTLLAACHPNNRHPNLAEKSAMAEVLDVQTAESRCPSFMAFAEDVRTRVAATLFAPAPPPEPNDDITPPT